MKILKFTLEGTAAFFKKPEVNSYVYFTYGNIHKVALLGMFGAILGYKGYNQMEQKKGRNTMELDCRMPEFYEKLKGLRISIVPNRARGFIPKKIQTFNNSVGYASQEQGGNLIVKEQWLEAPSWDICVLIDSPEGERLEKALCRQTCVYIPYLGKNDHLADIKGVCTLDAQPDELKRERLDSLFPKGMASFAELDEEEEEEKESYLTYKYQEKLPIALEPYTNGYILEDFIFSDGCVEKAEKQAQVYRLGDKTVMFW